MKNSSSPQVETRSGRGYWRSLDELAETPEFRHWAEREFPEGASECSDPVTRRHFMKIMSASFMLAGVGLAGTGCRRPVEKIEPFTRLPEGYVHGVPQYYATAMPSHGGAVPLVAKAHDGRPVKVEGNALHPQQHGGTDRFAQASILNLYDPDRSRRFVAAAQNAPAAGAIDFLAHLSSALKEKQGKGLALLAEPSSSPSRERLQKQLLQALPQARWFEHESLDLSIHRRAASIAFGKPVAPRYELAKADVIVTLDCDLLGSEEDLHNHIRQFAQRRHLAKSTDSMNRLYVVEPLMSVTGFSADHRLRVCSTRVAQVAAAIASEVLGQNRPAELQAFGTLPPDAARWAAECARDLANHRGRCLVVAGYRQPLAVHLLVYAINDALGNIGETVVLQEAAEPSEDGLGTLAKALTTGEVETLVILGANPVYTAPVDLDWTVAQRKAKTVVRLAYYEDETFPLCTWHFPMAHYLESWGDARTSDGTLVAVQPLIAPLFGGWTELEVLARLMGASVNEPYAIVRETFAAIGAGGDFEGAWRKFLHDGFLAGSAAKPVSARMDMGGLGKHLGSLKSAAPDKERLEVIFHRDYSVDDGRYNNNGWLQEMPDPVTKVAWDNVVQISRKTAEELGVQNSDVVEITWGSRSVRGPIWVQPGQADYTVGLALGYGRAGSGRVGKNVGFNAGAIRTSEAANFFVGASLTRVGSAYPIATTQSHWSLEGRPVVREVNLDQYRENPDFARRLDLEKPPVVASLYPNPLDELKKKGLHQWGMSIDLNMCTGCSACVIACQSENNVPIVGKDQVKRGREMHWLRIDRYYAGPPDKHEKREQYHRDDDQQFEKWIDDPQVVAQPMLCQHCEAAPCENVCPVNATSHDQEGLNVMTYNRCVGTRYCSNNCPYKVRRFNFFDYNKRPIDKLYLGPFGKRPDDEWDLIKMSKNPEVTVRMRGVMEKCTFCLQRIESAKISQKIKAGASGDVVVPDGLFTTACAQACPAGAIVFGNIADPESAVSKRKALDRDYQVLDFLYTRPRLTYLARVRNPNKAMPDYRPAPYTFENYEHAMGNPFEHGEPDHAGPATEHAPGKGAH